MLHECLDKAFGVAVAICFFFLSMNAHRAISCNDGFVNKALSVFWGKRVKKYPFKTLA